VLVLVVVLARLWCLTVNPAATEQLYGDRVLFAAQKANPSSTRTTTSTSTIQKVRDLG
jgi:hypothetical protein